VHSRVKNIGLDGSGTHSKDSKKNKKWDSLLNSSEEEIIFEKLKIDKGIARIFRNRYGTLTSLAFGKFKRLVKIIVLWVNPHFLEN
jgi:hypothetical protein